MNALAGGFSFIDNILLQAFLALPLLLSMVVSYRCLQVPDVTIDGSSILAASLCVVSLQKLGLPLPFAMLAGVIAAFGAGVVTGVLVEVLRINALLAGILNAFIFYSVGLLLIGATADFGSTTAFTWVRNADRGLTGSLPTGFVVHPFELLLLVGIGILLKLAVDWFLRREWGVALRGAGSNELPLQLRGINTKLLRIVGFGIANAIVGFGAILISMYEGSVQVMRWPGTIIFALSVAIVGWEAASQVNRVLRIRLTESSAILLGALIYFLVVRLCYTFSFPTALPRLLIAAYIIIVLAERNGLWRRLRETIG